MKKRLLVTLLISLILCLSLATAASAKTVVLKMGSPYMTVDGTKTEIDPGRGTKPEILSGRTLVPIRSIVQQMGGTIAWDEKFRQIVIATETKVIRMHLDTAVAEVKPSTGTVFRQVKLDVAPKSIKGRTMVPLRFVSEELGAQVGWNAPTKQITISFTPSSVKYTEWTGAWETNWGIIVFVQSGNTVKTIYDTDSLGKITGNSAAGNFSGTWYFDPIERGSITLTMAKDGKSFTGKYEFKENPSDPDSQTLTFEIKGKRN